MAAKRTPAPKSAGANRKKPPATKKKAGRKPRPVGAPSECTERVIKDICTAIMSGSRLETAAELNGVVYQTVLNWIRRGRRAQADPSADPKELIYVTFLRRVKQTLARREQESLDRIRRAGRQGDWKADAWWLKNGPQRKHYANVDEKKLTVKGGVEHEHTHRGVVATVSAQELAAMPLEARKALLEVLQRRKAAAGAPASPPLTLTPPLTPTAPAEQTDAYPERTTAEGPRLLGHDEAVRG